MCGEVAAQADGLLCEDREEVFAGVCAEIAVEEV
jgi:hypothetical protein